MNYATKEQALQASIAQGMKPEHIDAVQNADGTWYVTYSEQWYLDNLTSEE